MNRIDKCFVCGNEVFQNYLDGIDYFLTQEEFTIVKCSSCGFLFVNPRPEPQNLGKYYHSEEYISHSNASTGLVNKIYHIVRKRNHRKKLQIINAHAGPGKLLDIGCATGEFIHFCQQNNWKVIGVEPEKNARDFAISKYGLQVFDENFLKENKTEKFDAITLWHVLEHVSSLNDRIEEIKSLLAENGTLIIAVPNLMSFDADYYGKYWAGYDLPRHLYHFTQKTITQLFQNHGFELADLIPMKYDAFYVSLLSEKYLHGKKNIFKSFWIGLKSNRWAKKNNYNYSSLIYIFKQKN